MPVERAQVSDHRPPVGNVRFHPVPIDAAVALPFYPGRRELSLLPRTGTYGRVVLQERFRATVRKPMVSGLPRTSSGASSPSAQPGETAGFAEGSRKAGGTPEGVINFHEESLKKRLLDLVAAIGFSETSPAAKSWESKDKESIRLLHRPQRLEKQIQNQAFVARCLPRLIQFLASGEEVFPAQIRPEIQRIYSGTWESDLFRLASLTWSVPVSNGFGRRLRFLVWDRSNEKLIGLFAIGDPVFNLSVRDRLVGWDAAARSKRLVNLMDAYVLGAVPPYNQLLAGKMVACFVRSREVYDEFQSVYGERTGLISGARKQARLLAVTTSSSMGRSSVYNRLSLGGVKYFQPIGYTRGWGHFHIPENLFAELRGYLRQKGHPYADRHRYGDGPNWRLRTTRAALDALGMDGDLLRHGIRREVFLSKLCENAVEILGTGTGKPDTSSLLEVDRIASQALERWVVPRSRRDSRYRSWTRDMMRNLLKTEPRNVDQPKGPFGLRPARLDRSRPLSLGAWHQRLEGHFGALADQRRGSQLDVFALEHGLDEHETQRLADLLRGSLRYQRPSLTHWLAWVVYSAEQGYSYLGDEYWPSFEQETPHWNSDDRSKIQMWFHLFHKRFEGVKPSGRWADWFTIISWPITHAILPRYLQRHFARALYDARHALFATDSSEPTDIGRVLATNSRHGSDRFLKFLEQEELVGRIALAVLDGEAAPGALLYPKTFQRIVRDLERVQESREWLQEARYRVGDRFKGIARGILGHRLHTVWPRREEDPKPASLRPRLLLRHRAAGTWIAAMEWPLFSEVARRSRKHHQFLMETRCRLQGVHGPRPGGGCSQVRELPCSALTQRPTHLSSGSSGRMQPSNTWRTLNAGCQKPPWLFRIGQDGTAREIQGGVVRPGYRYILLAPEGNPLPLEWADECVIGCDGVHAVRLSVPDQVTAGPGPNAFGN